MDKSLTKEEFQRELQTNVEYIAETRVSKLLEMSMPDFNVTHSDLEERDDGMIYINPERLQVRLVQFVSLYRGEEALAMSTRSGSFVTLRELRDEVGNDAARFFYIMRKADQPTDFDLELAKAQTKDNPVYYIQYAHARICSVMNKLAEAGHSWDHDTAMQQLSRLDQSAESELIKQLSRYPEVLASAADQLEPHALAQYLKELAGQFHAWYNGHKVIVDDQPLRDARIALCKATGQVIANGLELLGVSAPESM